MKALPTEALIRGMKVKIKSTPTDKISPIDTDETTSYGICDRHGIFGNPGVIYINSALPLQEQWLTLWHEVLHFIAQDFEFYDIGVNDNIYIEILSGEIMNLCRQWKLL